MPAQAAHPVNTHRSGEARLSPIRARRGYRIANPGSNPGDDKR